MSFDRCDCPSCSPDARDPRDRPDYDPAAECEPGDVVRVLRRDPGNDNGAPLLPPFRFGLLGGAR